MRTRFVIVLAIITQLVGWRDLHRFELDPVFGGEVVRSPWFIHVLWSPVWGLGMPLATAALAMWLGSSPKPRLAWVALAIFATACALVMVFFGVMG